MSSHYFLCYETSDGIEYTNNLYDALCKDADLPKPWLDKRYSPKADDWHELIDQVIKTSDGLIFIMTPESIASSLCRVQWKRALNNLKPIIPIRFDSNVELPMRLEPRVPIEFGTSFELGLQKLLEKLRWLQTEDGVRTTMEYALIDAQAGLRDPGADIAAQEMRIEFLKSLLGSLRTKAEEIHQTIDARFKHIFISYSHRDENVMRDLKRILAKRGLKVWSDEKINQGDDDWTKKIQSALDQAGCVISILSPDAKNSEWVRRELSYAEIHNIRVFPILVRGDESDAVPIRLISTQRTTIKGDVEMESQLYGLFSDIYKHLHSISQAEHEATTET